jgi:hypothetical protein
MTGLTNLIRECVKKARGANSDEPLLQDHEFVPSKGRYMPADTKQGRRNVILTLQT